MVFTCNDRGALTLLLSANPRADALMPGLGGIRKLRSAPEGRGKNGAFRVIHAPMDNQTPILDLLLYARNEQASPMVELRQRSSQIVKAFKAKACGQ